MYVLEYLHTYLETSELTELTPIIFNMELTHLRHKLLIKLQIEYTIKNKIKIQLNSKEKTLEICSFGSRVQFRFT